MPLMSYQKKILAPVTWQIGRLGEDVDVHPGVIMDLTSTVRTFRDGTSRVVDAAIVAIQVTAQAENGGGKYLTLARHGQPIPTEFLWPRAKATGDGESLLIPGLDDFNTPEELQMSLQAAQAEAVKSNAFGNRLTAPAGTKPATETMNV